MYSLGLLGMAYATNAAAKLALSARVLIGLAQAGTTYAVIWRRQGNVAAFAAPWAMWAHAAAGLFAKKF